MDNKLSFITPDDFKISYTEFSDVCKKELHKTLEEWQSQPYNEKETVLKTWVRISPNIIKDTYPSMLYNDLSQNGWKKIEIRFVEDRTVSLLIILYL